MDTFSKSSVLNDSPEDLLRSLILSGNPLVIPVFDTLADQAVLACLNQVLSPSFFLENTKITPVQIHFLVSQDLHFDLIANREMRLKLRGFVNRLLERAPNLLSIEIHALRIPVSHRAWVRLLGGKALWQEEPDRVAREGLRRAASWWMRLLLERTGKTPVWIEHEALDHRGASLPAFDLFRGRSETEIAAWAMRHEPPPVPEMESAWTSVQVLAVLTHLNPAQHNWFGTVHRNGWISLDSQGYAPAALDELALSVLSAEETTGAFVLGPEDLIAIEVLRLTSGWHKPLSLLHRVRERTEQGRARTHRELFSGLLRQHHVGGLTPSFGFFDPDPKELGESERQEAVTSTKGVRLQDPHLQSLLRHHEALKEEWIGSGFEFDVEMKRAQGWIDENRLSGRNTSRNTSRNISMGLPDEFEILSDLADFGALIPAKPWARSPQHAFTVPHQIFRSMLRPFLHHPVMLSEKIKSLSKKYQVKTCETA